MWLQHGRVQKRKSVRVHTHAHTQLLISVFQLLLDLLNNTNFAFKVYKVRGSHWSAAACLYSASQWREFCQRKPSECVNKLQTNKFHEASIRVALHALGAMLMRDKNIPIISKAMEPSAFHFMASTWKEFRRMLISKNTFTMKRPEVPSQMATRRSSPLNDV